MRIIGTCLLAWASVMGIPVLAQSANQMELDTTVITGNTELPKYLYVVPWQDRKSGQKLEQKLVLHNLYGDLFDPLLPHYIPPDRFELLPEAEGKP